MIDRILYLPGAAGSTTFWAPVAERLTHPAEPVVFGWPGFGDNPPDPAIRSLDGLLGLVLAKIDRPVALVAQSMGGVLAIRAALERPALVRSLVLAATSGGIDLSRFEVADWRPDYVAEFPTAPRWFMDDRTDLEDRLAEVAASALLLWGDADPLSPLAVGEHLRRTLPTARLHVIPGGDHAFAHDRPAEVAPLIDAHLRDIP